MTGLRDQVAVITGASSGIGRSVALALAGKGAVLCLLGRNPNALCSVIEKTGLRPDRVKGYRVDLTEDDEVHKTASLIKQDFGRVDILVHSAGDFYMGSVESSAIEDLDRLYRINLRAPCLLTQALLPMIKPRKGQIVFINSSAVLNIRPDLGHYTATKLALKAVTDALRAEVNASGVRVLSVFPGRTATPMQKRVYAMERREYSPAKLMQPEDVAEVLVNALGLPRTAETTDIHLRPCHYDRREINRRGEK